MSDSCVSLTTGTISPDQRVNYANGMVLGVDEFLTEQQHRLEHAYRHERALHGYGTVYGLRVTTEVTGDDVTVTVAPGMLTDQFGRPAVITRAQCARLGAWLAAREQATPGTVAGRRGPSGELTVHVVAGYATCLDNLVPLPGTPCASSARTEVASRVRDAWDVGFSFDPPPMPRWDTDRRLARLLATVEIVAGLPAGQSSEDEIVAAVLALPDRSADGPDDLWPDPTPSGTPGLRLPAETAAEALDRIFTVWVTRVRPLLEPDLTEPGTSTPSGPGGTPEILLATVSFTAADPFDPLHPVITAVQPPDDAGRPYLLHTRLIQELRSLDADTVVVKPRELVTLAAAVDAAGRLTLDAWFHLPEPVSLPNKIEVRTEGGAVAAFTATAPGGADPADVWRLAAPAGFAARDGQQLQAVFAGDTTLVGAAGTTLAEVQESGVTLLNSDAGGSVLAYATVEIDPVVKPPEQRPSQASVEFITITAAEIADKRIGLEFWFHPQPRGPRDDVLVIDKPAFDIFDEVTGNQLAVSSITQSQLYRNVWNVVTGLPDNQKPLPAYLRVVFRPKEIPVETSGGKLTLLDWLEKARILFVGWNPDAPEIIAFTRVAPR